MMGHAQREHLAPPKLDGTAYTPEPGELVYIEDDIRAPFSWLQFAAACALCLAAGIVVGVWWQAVYA